jgi:hypothetical protein
MRLVLLLAVLVQYAPMRVCGIERVAFGSNCHEWSGAGTFESGHDSEPAGNPLTCICEQPKAVGHQSSQVADHALDWNVIASAPFTLEIPATRAILLAVDPDPQLHLRASVHLPLLI